MTLTSIKTPSAACLLLAALIIGSAVSAAAFQDVTSSLGRFADAVSSDDATAVNSLATTVADVRYDIADKAYKLEPRDAAKLIGDAHYIFIDIREPVEFEGRSIPGFVNIRLGDLLNGGEYKKIDKSKKIVLICEVGERGSNISIVLRLKGYQAYYIAGGFAEWMKQKQKFIGKAQLALPDFRNKKNFLSQKEVRALLASGKAVLIDLRSPAEFAKFHIEGAWNLPLVNLTTPQLEDALRQIPKNKQVIGVAYERFGAYYCKILGYLVEQRKGHFAGTLWMKPRNEAL